MKGIILAGGAGTRLHPVTKVISKQLLPIYDKPMVYYPLSMLLLARIREILLISTPRDIAYYRELLGDGSRIGVSIEYAVQDKPRGLADAYIVGEEFIGEDDVCLIPGDNVFYGQGMTDILKEAMSILDGAVIFGCYVNDPRSYGVVEFDEKFNVVSLEEKPEFPKSNYAIPGLYFYNNDVVEIAKKVKPSKRGEIEITSVNNEYLRRKQLKVKILGRGIAWLDTGTHRGLLDGANFVETVQTRQGLYVSCIEEIAFRKGFISRKELTKIAEEMGKTEYGEYLMRIVNGEI